MARLASANDIINRAAVECGLSRSTDPFADPDENFVQLSELLNGCGQEMVELFPWQILVKKYNITTQDTDAGRYPLPDDFSYMINQTGWEHSQSVAIGGPLSAQDWTYLEGRDLVSQSIYASFRLVENQVDIYPQPPPNGLDINFEYISRNWVNEAGTQNYNDIVGKGSDIVLYEPILIKCFLKAKFLAAKGFDATEARMEFENAFHARTGHDRGAMILSAGNNSRGFPFLHPYYSTPDTGYGGF